MGSLTAVLGALLLAACSSDPALEPSEVDQMADGRSVVFDEDPFAEDPFAQAELVEYDPATEVISGTEDSVDPDAEPSDQEPVPDVPPEQARSLRPSVGSVSHI